MAITASNSSAVRITRRKPAAKIVSQPRGGGKSAAIRKTLEGMRRFLLKRDEDETGVSGTGIVADGAVAPDGRAVLFWRWSAAGTTGGGSMGIYTSISELQQIHGHGGRTRIVWLDPLKTG